MTKKREHGAHPPPGLNFWQDRLWAQSALHGTSRVLTTVPCHPAPARLTLGTRAWEPGLDPRQPLSPPLTATPDDPQYGLHSLDGAQDPGGPVGPALVLSAEPST